MSYELNILSFVNEYLEYQNETITGEKYKFQNRGISLMDICVNSPELDIFKSESVMDVIDFKWQ